MEEEVWGKNSLILEPLVYTISALDADVKGMTSEDLELIAKLSSGETSKMDLQNHDNKAQLTLANQYDKI